MSSRGQISARQRNATYRPNGKLAQHVLDATIVDATITEPVRLCRALAPMLVGRAVIETGRQFYLVASKFDHRFYIAIYRNGEWQCSSREESTVKLVVAKAEAYRQELLAKRQAVAA